MKCKPQDKVLIKINKNYNESYEGDRTIVSLKEYNKKETLQIQTS